MDNVKFGGFLAQCRKEKGWTQKELADRLHVSDKAVSKWERGQGFPDIKLIEPLAEALEVSILELMRGERIPEEARPADIGPEIAAGMVDLAAHRQKLERRNTAIAVISAAALICMLFLVDEIEGFHLIEFSMMVFPWVCWGICPVLLVICWLRHRKGLSWHLLAFCTFWVFALPILAMLGLLILMDIALRLGAQVPWT